MFRFTLLLLLLSNAVCAQVPDSSYLDFSYTGNGTLLDCKGGAKRRNQRDFQLPGQLNTTYRIDVLEDSTSLLLFRTNDTWTLLDTLSEYTAFVGDIRTCEVNVPYAQLVDFNRDGYCDLKVGVSTNMNGNDWVKLFLYNSATNRLEILRNYAEESDIWDAPEFVSHGSAIICTRVASAFGLSFESRYKLIGLVAYPVLKKEHDNSNVDSYTGQGAIYTRYTGYNQRWKVAHKVTYRLH